VSGSGAELDLPSEAIALFGEGGGQAVIACAPENVGRLPATVPLRRLGIAGGDALAETPLAELRDAWSAFG
jgi:hypothetical protein